MGYYNYHAEIKKKIKQGELIGVTIVNEYHKISPCMLMVFVDKVMPIREYRWVDYLDILNKLNIIITDNR